MVTAAESSSGGLKRPTSSVGLRKSSTSRLVTPTVRKSSCADIRSYAAKTSGERLRSSMA